MNMRTYHFHEHSFNICLKFYYAYKGSLDVEYLKSKMVRVKSQKLGCMYTKAQVYTRKKLGV